MGHSAKIILAFALICAVGHASILQNIINNTKFRGKGMLNTTNGLNMGYKAGVSFNLGGREINIVDVGVNFDAVPTYAKVNDTLTTNVRYNGALTFNEDSNVTLSGQTQLSTTVNSTYDNKTKTTNTVVNNQISDSNSFVVRSGATVITARGTENLGVIANVAQKGDSIQVGQNSNINVNIRGVVVENGTSLGAFTATSDTTSTTTQKVTLHNCRLLPNATFSGKTSFNNANFLSFQNTNYNTSKSGSAGFIGSTTIKGGNTDLSVGSNLGLNYDYKTSASVNGTVTGSSTVKGVGKVNTNVNTQVTAAGSNVEYFTGGRIYQVAKNTVPGQKASVKPVKALELYDMSEESTEFCIQPRKKPTPSPKPKPTPSPKPTPTPKDNSYYSLFTAGWKAGAQITNEVTSNTTATTNTTAGVTYNAAGIDTKSWKPWTTKGSKSATASIKTTLLADKVNAISNVSLSGNASPDFNNKLAQVQVPEVDTRGIYFPQQPRL